MLALAKPWWSALPSCALKTQILASLARTAEIPQDELSRLWGLFDPSAAPARIASARVAHAGRAVRPTLGARPAARTPADQLVRILMTNSGLWDALSAQDHELLAEVTSWQASALRWLERTLTDQGVQEWPLLRQILQEHAEPFAPKVVQLVDGAEFVISSTPEDLQSALQQLRRALALEKTDTLRLLGRA